MKNKKNNVKNGISYLINELPMGKDFINNLLNNTQKAREDFTKLILLEIEKYGKNLDPRMMIDYVLEKYDFEINAKISLKPKKKKSK